jgi:hypothetical protein
LTAAREQINALKDDKEWLKGQVASLTDTLKQIEHKPDAVIVPAEVKPEGITLWKLLKTPLRWK